MVGKVVAWGHAGESRLNGDWIGPAHSSSEVVEKLSTTQRESSLSGSSIAFLSSTNECLPVLWEMIFSPCSKSLNFFSHRASTERFSAEASLTTATLAA